MNTGRKSVKGIGAILLGMALVLTGFFAVPAMAAVADGQAIWGYQVRKGDTLWLLSQRYGKTVAEIRSLNPGADLLEVGQYLYLPITLRNEGAEYTVQLGDTLYLVSLAAGCRVDEVQKLSGLSGTDLRPGQKLLIPLTKVGTQLYRVGPGESLYSIAKNRRVTMDALTKLNPIPSNQVMAGQVILVPQATPEPTPAPEPTPTPEPTPAPEPTPTPEPDPKPEPIPQLTVYRVQSGDNLWSVAKKFGTTADAVYQTNKLHSDVLMPGQPLYIPPGKVAVEVEGPRGEQRKGFGEFLDWEWARWIYNVGTVATVIDFDTKRTFKVRYMGGSNHADSEPLTAQDTQVMKDIFGNWTWDSRAILLQVGDRLLAASMSAMPHDVETNLENDFNGHFDLYFWNSRSHNNNSLQPKHQANVLKAAGK